MYVWNPVSGRKIVNLPVPNVVNTVMKEGKKLNLPIGEQAELYLKLRQEVPTLLIHRLNAPIKGTEVLVNSMSDPAEWKKGWIEKVLERINKKSQQKKVFVFLTRRKSVVRRLGNLPANTGVLILPKGIWIGKVEMPKFIGHLTEEGKECSK